MMSPEMFCFRLEKTCMTKQWSIRNQTTLVTEGLDTWFSLQKALHCLTNRMQCGYPWTHSYISKAYNYRIPWITIFSVYTAACISFLIISLYKYINWDNSSFNDLSDI